MRFSKFVLTHWVRSMNIMNTENLSDTSTELLTIKQLERAISQSFFAVYRQKLGCSPQKVICNICDNFLVIVAEEGSTPLELTMHKKGQTEIVSTIRHSVNRVLKIELSKIIQELALLEVVDLGCEFNIDSHRLIATAILERSPSVRSKRSKIKRF